MNDSAADNNSINQTDGLDSLRKLRELLQAESAQLQIKGRALSGAELTRLQKIDRMLVSLNEISQFISEPSASEKASAEAEVLPAAAATSKPVKWAQKQAFAGVFSALQTHRAELENIKGVVSVRPGYHFAGGSWTGAPAIVVSVFPNLLNGSRSSALNIPKKIGDIFVDVVAAMPEEQLRFRQNAAAPGAEAVALNPISSEQIERWKRILDGDQADETADFAENFATEEALVPYTKPEDLTLDRTTVDKMICHVSPDSGWKLLSRFLAGVRERLTVAIYDFKATHIEEVLRRSVQDSDSRLSMIMHFDGNESEELFARQLEDALEDKFDTVWASNKRNGLFKTSYHTKVAVRDGKAFWLSSGNWTRTSQPDVGANPAPGNLYTKGNREWNVIIEDKALAKTFEDYIRFDISQSQDLPEPEAFPPLPDLLIPVERFTAEAEDFSVTQPFVFQPETFEQVDVQPLLTPDNYIGEIINLIKSAEEKLYLQFSYIYSPSANNGFKQLIKAICDKIEDELDVRIIVSSNQKREHTDELIAMGMDSVLRKQKSKLHNKGIMVDSKTVVVGSHNWSPAGTLQNRDASLIIYDAGVTRYYESIFLWDWENNTSSIGAAPEAMPQIAEGETTPTGMVRVAWREFYED